MPKNRCQICGKFYNPKKHDWSAGYGCDYFCSKQCCNKAYDAMFDTQIIPNNPYHCPCY